jgi:hypothetical protein
MKTLQIILMYFQDLAFGGEWGHFQSKKMKHIDAVDAVPLNHLKHINAVYHSTFQPV